MGNTSRVFILGVLCVFCVEGNFTTNTVQLQTDHKRRWHRETASGRRSPQPQSCDLSSLEARLQRLEAHLDEKFDSIRREVWSSSRSIEQINIAARNAVEELRNEIRTEQGNVGKSNHVQTNPSLEFEREIQVVIATLRLLTSDMADVRQNLSNIANTTNAIRDQIQIETSIQKVFSLSNPSQPSQPKPIPTNCQDVKNSNYRAATGVYLIQPKTAKSAFLVYCDMDFQDGGWLAIQNRVNGEQDFYREWQDYKMGFGNIAGEHWLGLDHVHELTGTDIHELMVQLVDVNNVKTQAHYSHFSIGSELEGYPLKVLGSYRGNAGDSLSYHAGHKFSTKDKDQDSWAEGNCAQSHGGAWWYKSCDKSNLNGRYLPGDQPDILLYQPMYWGSFGGPQSGLKYARMLIRPKGEEIMQSDTAIRDF